jgi:ATP/maltotriose-dependent transcriptional regulator MalT
MEKKWIAISIDRGQTREEKYLLTVDGTLNAANLSDYIQSEVISMLHKKEREYDENTSDSVKVKDIVNAIDDALENTDVAHKEESLANYDEVVSKCISLIFKA